MIFTSMNSPFTAARYHSLVIEKESFPHDALEVTAWTEDGLVMAARHKKYKHIQVFTQLRASQRITCRLGTSHTRGVLSFSWVQTDTG
jgi:hypothetical protein